MFFSESTQSLTLTPTAGITTLNYIKNEKYIIHSSNFSLEIETTITSHNFDSYEFYSIFKSTFRKVQNKFNAYISLYPTLLF